MRVIFLSLILIPIIEIWVLIRVGGVAGAIPTITLVILTAFVGIALLRQQSWAAISRAQTKMHKGELPAKEMVEGLFLAFGGALLITPGFITDAIGFCCLIPLTRKALISWWLEPLVRGAFLKGAVNMSQSMGGAANDPHNPPHNDAIEGEFRRDD